MIEELPDRDQNGVKTSSADACAKQWINNQTAQYGINQNFHWMFIKAGKDFQSTSRMMNLM
jgi:hypothetical protein